MRVKLSNKGRLVLPKSGRDCLELSSGDAFQVDVDSNHRIVLTRIQSENNGATVGRDPDTGYPVLIPTNGKKLTTKLVKEILAGLA